MIAPATANVIGKIASGLADDLLTTTVMATKAPVLICPAMNTNMYENIIVKENINKLSASGYLFIEPAYGELACRAEGYGRLPEIPDIIEEIESVLTDKDLKGENILVTAGPTREPFDPVRFITNYSSGKMGYALAIAGKRRGAHVTLISGPSALPVPRGVKYISVSTAVEMRDAVMENMEIGDCHHKSRCRSGLSAADAHEYQDKETEGELAVALGKESGHHCGGG